MNTVDADLASEFEDAKQESQKLEQTLENIDRSKTDNSSAIKEAETLVCYYQADPGSVTAEELRNMRLRLS